jgi:N-acyl homoserine lactone hydrolase
MNAKDRRFTHLFVRPTTNLNLEGFGPLKEWQVQHEEAAPFDYVDIFGDGSALGLHIPGHTKGSMAFLVRSTKGPVLMVGDGSHTTWGWENGVEPGTFNTDGEKAAGSLAKLRALAAAYPTMEVHLGHQRLAKNSVAMHVDHHSSR